MRRLLAATDLLVDGPYMAERPERHRPWVGSDNQRFRFLTERYSHLAGDLETLPNRLEIRISPSGEVAINGFATVSVLEELISGDLPTLKRRQR